MTTVKIDGQERLLKFNMRAIRKLGDLVGKDAVETIVESKTMGMCDLTGLLIIAGVHAANPEDKVLTKEEADSIVDEMEISEAHKVVDAFMAAMKTPDTIKDTPGEK